MIQRLQKLLLDAQVPIEGVSYNGESTRIDFAPEATDQDRSKGTEIAATFDWSPRQPRSAEEIEADVVGLSANDREQLLTKLIAERIQADPFWAMDIGVSVAGDRPER